jgi:hypothetical protein
VTQADTGIDLDVAARLSVSLDGMTAELRRRNDLEQRQRELSRHITVIPQLTCGQLTSSAPAVLDVPNLMGPRTGFAWDVHRFTCSTFTSGTVSLYLDGVADGGQVMIFTAPGVVLSGKLQGFIPAGSRLVAQAVNLSGTVTLALGGIVEIESAWVSDYVL